MTRYTLRDPEGYGSAEPAPETRKITVLVVEPDALPRVAEIDAELSAYQGVVGGWIEAVYPYADLVALVCNEEGKINGSAPNRPLLDYDYIYGTFFVCGITEDDFCSLTPAQIERYSRIFAVPGMYFGEPDTVLA